MAANGSTQTVTKIDPAPSFKFHIGLELNGVVVAEFSECSGLGFERDVMTYEEGGLNDSVHQLPGRYKGGTVTLKRGITASTELWSWFKQGLLDGAVQRQDLSILLFNTLGETVRRWNLLQAFPKKWTGPSLNAAESQVAFETVEIVYQGVQWT